MSAEMATEATGTASGKIKFGLDAWSTALAGDAALRLTKELVRLRMEVNPGSYPNGES